MVESVTGYAYSHQEKEDPIPRRAAKESTLGINTGLLTSMTLTTNGILGPTISPSPTGRAHPFGPLTRLTPHRPHFLATAIKRASVGIYEPKSVALT